MNCLFISFAHFLKLGSLGRLFLSSQHSISLCPLNSLGLLVYLFNINAVLLTVYLWPFLYLQSSLDLRLVNIFLVPEQTNETNKMWVTLVSSWLSLSSPSLARWTASGLSAPPTAARWKQPSAAPRSPSPWLSTSSPPGQAHKVLCERRIQTAVWILFPWELRCQVRKWGG